MEEKNTDQEAEIQQDPQQEPKKKVKTIRPKSINEKIADIMMIYQPPL